MTGILFDFFGTLVEYSASRVEQGYDATHKLLLNRLPRCFGEIFGGRLQLSVYEGVADA
jgi:hypothetical protein